MKITCADSVINNMPVEIIIIKKLNVPSNRFSGVTRSQSWTGHEDEHSAIFNRVENSKRFEFTVFELYDNFICYCFLRTYFHFEIMKIENDADPCMWFSECLGPEPQDWMKDVGLDWFDEELLGRPESPVLQSTTNDDDDDDDSSADGHDNSARHHQHSHTHQCQQTESYHDYPSYTIESSAWLIQQNQQSGDSDDESSPPPILPSMIPGTRNFSDELHRIRRPYAFGSFTSTSTTANEHLVRLAILYFVGRV